MSPRALFLAFLLAQGCTANAVEADADEAAAEADAVGVSAVMVDLDASGSSIARVEGLTLTFDSGARIEVVSGQHVLAIRGRTSRNLTSMFSSVPDDKFGDVRMRGPRSFDLVLTGDHEINTVLSGLPLWLSIDTASGSLRKYQASVQIGTRLHDPSGATSIKLGPIEPVAAGTSEDPLRYRMRVDTTKTFASIASSDAVAIKRSTRRYDLDWTYAGIEKLLEKQSLTVSGGSESATTAIEVRVEKLGLTTKTAEAAWPTTCVAKVRTCVAKTTTADFGACGSYREVETCKNEDPPVSVGVVAAQKSIAADILAKTGIKTSPTVLSVRSEGASTIALVSLGRGGSAEWTIAKNVALTSIVAKPVFIDDWQAQRFQKQLREQHAMPDATVVAIGTISGSVPRWQMVVDRAGVRSTVAVEATDATTSKIIPFAYDEQAFRAIAAQLIVEHADALAAKAGLYAELEVFLNAVSKFSSDKGLEVSESDSPVTFDPANEVQLVAHSIWGDVAFFVTVSRIDGRIRVADFH